MITGTSVQVVQPVVIGTDRFGNEVKTPGAPTTVNNVLVVPGATSDLDASRPEGVSVAYSLHFPKTWTGDLEGADVVLPEPWEGTYHVVGKPGQYMDANTPTKWHTPVEVEVAHG